MVDRAVEYGCDGIFFDQIGKAAPVCWSPEHGHPVPFVESTRYRADQIRRLREYANARAPEMSFGVEHVTDLTAQYCDYVHPYPGGANLRNPDWKNEGNAPGSTSTGNGSAFCFRRFGFPTGTCGTVPMWCGGSIA